MSDTALAIYILMGYSWVVGWLVACGGHYSASRQTGRKFRIGYLLLLLTWPHYLGS